MLAGATRKESAATGDPWDPGSPGPEMGCWPLPSSSQAPASALHGQHCPRLTGEQTAAQTGPKTCPGAHYRVGAEAASGSPGSPRNLVGPHMQGEGLGQSRGRRALGVPGIPRVSLRACSWIQVHRRCSLYAPSAPPGSPHRPKYKGKYCVGERKRFRLCGLQACPPGHPSFRQVQCSRFDAMPYKGRLYTWVPVVNDGESCCPRATAAPGGRVLGARGHPPQCGAPLLRDQPG